MPKKRFSSQYNKPRSTVHPSLSSSAAASSSSTQSHAPPSVNDLISSLRKSNVSASSSAPSTLITPTLPPQIRQLLAQPETPPPAPRARDRRRFDANGRRLPAGPAPPRSWLAESRWAVSNLRKRRDERLFPSDPGHLPGLPVVGEGRRLDEMCMRAMAQSWEFTREYEVNNLADLPTRLRMLLLSHIAVHGPEDGIGFEGLKAVLIPQTSNYEVDNERFYRLDLSGSVGRTVSFKQLAELFRKPEQPLEDQDAEVSWEDSMPRYLTPPLPNLTHLSLSHPPDTISWPRLLLFAKQIPTLTHLSLAYWPVPSLTPNARTAVMTSSNGDVQYGGTNYYSHTLDNDFREASMILHRLAKCLYSLEYLDLSGCGDWIRALRWTNSDDTSGGSLDWSKQWPKLLTLRVHSGIVLHEESEYSEVVRYVSSVEEAFALEDMLAYHAKRGGRAGRQVKWIEVEKDNWSIYRSFWMSSDAADKKKRHALDILDHRYPPWRAANMHADEEHETQPDSISTAWD